MLHFSPLLHLASKLNLLTILKQLDHRFAQNFSLVEVWVRLHLSFIALYFVSKLYVTPSFFCFTLSFSLSRTPIHVYLLLTSNLISPRRSLDLTITSRHSSILDALHVALSTPLRFQFRLQYHFTLLWLTLQSCFSVLQALLRISLRI